MKQTDEDRLEIRKLAYNEGRKGLADQDTTLTTIRQRAVAIGGLSGLAATFLGKEAIAKLPLREAFYTWKGIPELIGILSLFMSVIWIVDILRPRNGFVFHSYPNSILKQFANGPNATTISKTYAILAIFSEDNYKNNKGIIDKLFLHLFYASIAMMIQFPCWLIVLY